MATKGIDLSEFAPTRKGPSCSVGVLLSGLSGERLEKAVAALAAPNPPIQNQKIADVFKSWTGETIDAQSISRHRNKKCKCD